MVKPICERNGICKFLVKEISRYRYENRGMIHTGSQLNYYCINPKKFEGDGYNLLNNEKKYKKCGFKVTHKLEQFIEG